MSKCPGCGEEFEDQNGEFDACEECSSAASLGRAILAWNGDDDGDMDDMHDYFG